MCSLKKNAVIFQVGNDIKDPIVVIQQQMFSNEEPDSCIPLVAIYNGTHYQSVFPASKQVRGTNRCEMQILAGLGWFVLVCIGLVLDRFGYCIDNIVLFLLSLIYLIYLIFSQFA
jgi:hypothetical protein